MLSLTPSLFASRRGTASTETALTIPIMCFFFVFAFAMWNYTMADHRAYSDAHAATFAKAVRFLHMSEIESPPDFEGGSPAAAALPPTTGVADNTLVQGYEAFENFPIHGWGSHYFRAFPTIGEEFGGFDVNRESMAVRASWGLFAFPFAHTQHPDEADPVIDWYLDAREATINDEVRRAFGLDF